MTLLLYLLCVHPGLPPSSAVALTPRAVGGLTTQQIGAAEPMGETNMGQRSSRAKLTVAGVGLNPAGLNSPGDVATVLRVQYPVFNEGYSRDVDLASESIRLTR